MQETVNSLNILVQAGAVGIALALIWLVFKLVTTLLNHFQDTVNHNTDAWNKNTEVLAKLSEKIDSITK